MKILYFTMDEEALIAEAIEKFNNADIEFFYVLNDFRYYDLIDKQKCLQLFKNFNINLYKNYDYELPKEVINNLYSNLLCDKWTMKTKSSDYQIKHALSVAYRLYEYIKKINPDYLMFSGGEMYYLKVATDIAKSLNIKTLHISGMRNFDRYGFYLSWNQKKADFFYTQSIDEKYLIKAQEFLANFRNGQNNYCKTLFKFTQNKPKKSLFKRVIDNIKFLFKKETKYYVTNPTIFQKIYRKYYLRKIKSKIIQKTCYKKYTTKEFDFNTKYIFFPLHITPESSINFLAPFWLDQMRLIDLILLNLPANYKLVIKEHPGMMTLLYRRKCEFFENLYKKAGVIVVNNEVPTRDLIQNSQFVVGINGTALLEAFFLNKKAICSVDFMFSDFIYKIKDFDELRDIFLLKKEIKVLEDKEKIEIIARFYQYSYDNFIFNSPNRYPYVISQENIINFISSLRDFIQKELSDKTKK